MIKKRVISLLSALFLCLSVFLFSSCGEETPYLRVMVENGAHFQVLGESVKSVPSGGDVSFPIGIDEGFYYVSNNKNAEFLNGVLTLKGVKTPQTIVLNVAANIYGVQLNACAGMKIYDGEEAADGSLLKEVAHGDSVSFDVRIDPDKEYVGCTIVGGNENEAADTVVYENGKITLRDVRGAREIFVQLRNKSDSTLEIARVELLLGEGYSISGESVKEISVGGDVSFAIEVKAGYYYVSNNCGADYADGVVTLKNISSDQEIRLIFRRSDVQTVNYANGRAEIATAEGGAGYAAVANEGYVFTYWSYLSEGKREIRSYANDLWVPTGEGTPVELTPVFVRTDEAQLIVYHANGGKIYDSDDESVTYAFASEVYLYPAAMGEWCFKTFYRTGYVPLEYNLAADGSGEAISPGGRIYSDEKRVELYITWAKESPAADFAYERRETDGEVEIRLVSYRGSESKVTIPTEIEGMPVRTVAEGCFRNWSGTQVVLTKNLKTVEKYAFDNCANLKCVYLCDSVENIYNESFRTCENFSDLRMIAVLPPVYSNHLIGATVRRFETLYNERNERKTNILFYGGSSVFQGIDGKTLAGIFDSSAYRILNCGQNAYVSGPLMLELYSQFMHWGSFFQRGDVMVYLPEYCEVTYSNELDMPSWLALEELYDAFRLIDIRNYENVLGSFYDFQHGSGKYAFVGKSELLRDGKALTYEDYNDSFDEYFTRSEDFEIVKTNLRTESMTASIEELKELAINVVCNVDFRCYQKNSLTLYFASGCLWEDAYIEEKMVYVEYENWLKENLNFPYISNVLDHLFEEKYMSDSISHLTREGAKIHSIILGDELHERMRFDGYPI